METHAHQRPYPAPFAQCPSCMEIPSHPTSEAWTLSRGPFGPELRRFSGCMERSNTVQSVGCKVHILRKAHLQDLDPLIGSRFDVPSSQVILLRVCQTWKRSAQEKCIRLDMMEGQQEQHQNTKLIKPSVRNELQELDPARCRTHGQ